MTDDDRDYFVMVTAERARGTVKPWLRVTLQEVAAMIAEQAREQARDTLKGNLAFLAVFRRWLRLCW